MTYTEAVIEYADKSKAEQREEQKIEIRKHPFTKPERKQIPTREEEASLVEAKLKGMKGNCGLPGSI